MERLKGAFEVLMSIILWALIVIGVYFLFGDQIISEHNNSSDDDIIDHIHKRW